MVGSVGLEVKDGQLMLKYRVGTGSKAIRHEYPVSLGWTACTYGGQRPWFLCPGCGHRVALLYGGEYFFCRRCHNLSYWTQRQGAVVRAEHRAEKLRKRLVNGWQRPKGMHEQTFTRLVAEIDSWEEVANAERIRQAYHILSWMIL